MGGRYGKLRTGIRECLKTLQKHFCDLAIKVPETCYMGIPEAFMGQQEKIKWDGEEEIFFCYRNICIIKPAHRIVQVLLKCNSSILSVIIR